MVGEGQPNQSSIWGGLPNNWWLPVIFPGPGSLAVAGQQISGAQQDVGQALSSTPRNLYLPQVHIPIPTFDLPSWADPGNWTTTGILSVIAVIVALWLIVRSF